MKAKYDVISYWDVWYDESGPYVNDQVPVGTIEWDLEKMDDIDIVRDLIAEGYLAEWALDYVDVLWSTERFFEIMHVDGEPLLGLRISDESA